jgi:hypothetical protein
LLYGNQLEGPLPASLGRCISLVEIDLGHNQISGSLTQGYSRLIGLTKLEQLYLGGNPLSIDVDVTGISANSAIGTTSVQPELHAVNLLKSLRKWEEEGRHGRDETGLAVISGV